MLRDWIWREKALGGSNQNGFPLCITTSTHLAITRLNRQLTQNAFHNLALRSRNNIFGQIDRFQPLL
jgi:hypothetical protein